MSESSHIHHSRRLFQHLVVGTYTIIEIGKLKYIRLNQKKLRCEIYKGLTDAVVRGENNMAARAKRVIIPSSFIGGACYMIQNYQDVMAICKWIGYSTQKKRKVNGLDI